MGQRKPYLTICSLVCCLSAAIPVDARGDELPVRIEHLGWTSDKVGWIHNFRISLVNRHDKPVWFLFPLVTDEPLSKGGVFEYGHEEQPFQGERFDGRGGSVVEVKFLGWPGFTAFRLPAHGRIQFEELSVVEPGDCGTSRLSELVVLEAGELKVNGKTCLEKWLPYGTTSGSDVVAKRPGWFDDAGSTDLNSDEEGYSHRKDNPKERVKLVEACKPVVWTVRSHAHGERTP